jgi:hypothetical protein
MSSAWAKFAAEQAALSSATVRGALFEDMTVLTHEILAFPIRITTEVYLLRPP